MNFQAKSCFFVRFGTLLSPESCSKPAKSSLQRTQSFYDWFFGCRLKMIHEISNDCDQNEASERLRRGCQWYGCRGSDFGRPHHFLSPTLKKITSFPLVSNFLCKTINTFSFSKGSWLQKLILRTIEVSGSAWRLVTWPRSISMNLAFGHFS